MTFEEFTRAAPQLAEIFTSLCFTDDTRLVERGILSAPRMSLHSPECWTYERGERETWRAVGAWGEAWEWNGAWRCLRECPFRSSP